MLRGIKWSFLYWKNIFSSKTTILRRVIRHSVKRSELRGLNTALRLNYVQRLSLDGVPKQILKKIKCCLYLNTVSIIWLNESFKRHFLNSAVNITSLNWINFIENIIYCLNQHIKIYQQLLISLMFHIWVRNSTFLEESLYLTLSYWKTLLYSCIISNMTALPYFIV